MKLLVLFGALSISLSASGVDTAEYKTVYILPMANGLDQFLAIKLTTGLVMQVVTDPQKADSIFTDRIGTAFEDKLDEIYGKHPKSTTENPNDPGKPAMQPLSRGKGAIFLVDPKTRTVIWSAYEHSKSSTPDEMNHMAEKIASRLERARKGK